MAKNYGGKWGDEDCIEASVNVVCQKSLEVPVCDPDWINRGDKCYKFIDEHQNYTNARKSCSLLGGVIAEPKSFEENSYLKGFATDIWIGMDDALSEGV